MKKIIVPVDFTLHSENALRTASFFAKKYKAEILVVHMLEINTPVISSSPSYVHEQTVFELKLTEKKFGEYLDKPYLKDVKVTPIIKHYKSFSDLHRTAEEEKADLIILSSHGATGIKEMFFGSNAEVVVRNSTVPVLVIKGLPIDEAFKKAVFACDFSNDFIEPFKKAREILAFFECDEMHLLYVNTPGAKFRTTKDKKERIDTFLKKLGTTSKEVNIAEVADFSIEEGILEFAKTNESDLIIMPTHGKHGIEHFFEGSIAEDVVNHAVLPVLTVKM
ncbi:nucleotide-binding universal stress UspA family protein [Tenacibaculum skagerrakense]|uniref:Nucleotide-binding universal stress UspA family protein n=1 Tax=Tenacibaculum skagerrakense TaxID=186571 RepID=A0A4V2SM13_9FLAO|nr:universal stress protein [Tenacibaculum skagerrakense]TCP25216.1 nucleotide-binding universal stress UspA family protein [Tenacibaculum skagerrakense]